MMLTSGSLIQARLNAGKLEVCLPPANGFREVRHYWRETPPGSS
jgi:hypothetical protein